MEKHFWLGAVLLAVLLALSLGITWFMSVAHSPIHQTLEQAAQAVLQDDPELAVSLVWQAEARWQRFRNLSAAVADHDPIEETDRLFSQLAVYARAEEWTEFASCCTQLSRQVRSLIQAHIPSWWNLL